MNSTTSTLQSHYLQGRQPLKYFIYVPERVRKNAPVLVSVHGISRNADIHVRRFARRADRYGVVVVAPLFDAQHYPDYQRLGLSGARADLALNALLDEVGRYVGVDTKKVYLFGYSGGGQFVHRYAMAYPERVAAIVVGAAGWYTFPDADRRFPYGTAPHRKLPELRFDETAFLRIAAHVMVGEDDIVRDQSVRQTEYLDRRQGSNRVERGRRWVAAMTQAAQRLNLETEFRFILLPDSDHSFSRSVKHGGLAKQVFHCLFGPPPSARQVLPVLAESNLLRVAADINLGACRT